MLFPRVVPSAGLAPGQSRCSLVLVSLVFLCVFMSLSKTLTVCFHGSVHFLLSLCLYYFLFILLPAGKSR